MSLSRPCIFACYLVTDKFSLRVVAKAMHVLIAQALVWEVSCSSSVFHASAAIFCSSNADQDLLGYRGKNEVEDLLVGSDHHSTISSGHRKSEHCHPHARTASPTTLIDAARKHALPVQHPSANSCMLARDLLTKFEIAPRALILSSSYLTLESEIVLNQRKQSSN
jgi:hypothetical protein